VVFQTGQRRGARSRPAAARARRPSL